MWARNINYYSGRIGTVRTMRNIFLIIITMYMWSLKHREYIDLTPIRIGVVIGSMLALDVVGCGFEPRWGKTKIIKFAFALIIKEQQQRLIDTNQDKVSEWSDMSTRGLLVQTKGIRQCRHYLIECNWFSPWYSCNIAQLAFNNNHSLTHTQTIYTSNSSFLWYRDRMRPPYARWLSLWKIALCSVILLLPLLIFHKSYVH